MSFPYSPILILTPGSLKHKCTTSINVEPHFVTLFGLKKELTCVISFWCSIHTKQYSCTLPILRPPSQYPWCSKVSYIIHVTLECFPLFFILQHVHYLKIHIANFRRFFLHFFQFLIVKVHSTSQIRYFAVLSAYLCDKAVIDFHSSWTRYKANRSSHTAMNVTFLLVDFTIKGALRSMPSTVSLRVFSPSLSIATLNSSPSQFSTIWRISQTLGSTGSSKFFSNVSAYASWQCPLRVSSSANYSITVIIQASYRENDKIIPMSISLQFHLEILSKNCGSHAASMDIMIISAFRPSHCCCPGPLLLDVPLQYL